MIWRKRRTAGGTKRGAARTLAVLLLTMVLLAACREAPPTPTPQPEEATPIPSDVAAPVALVAAPGGANGRILFIRGGNIWVWANDQGYQLTTDGGYRQPRWSPDGNSMVYVRVGESYGDLWVADLAGNNGHALTANRAKNVQQNSKAYVDNSFLLSGPSWARLPNGGDRIVFSTDREANALSLWVLNGVSGKAQPVFGTKVLPGQIEGASLSPDGKFVVFTYNVVDTDGITRSTQIYLVDLDAGIYRALTSETNGAYDPSWSPDGAWISYSARQGDETNLFVITPDGTGRQRVVSGGKNRGTGWSPDSKRLAFVRQQGTGFALYSVDVSVSSGVFSVSQPQRLGDFSDVDPASGVSWAR